VVGCPGGNGLQENLETRAGQGLQCRRFVTKEGRKGGAGFVNSPGRGVTLKAIRNDQKIV